MDQGLCNCAGYDDKNSCGGISIYDAEQTLAFLDNVASILDKVPHARAFLAGENPMGIRAIKEAVQVFNSKHLMDFQAQIERDERGSFIGITIKPVAPTPCFEFIRKCQNFFSPDQVYS